MEELSPEAKAILAGAPKLPVDADHWQAIIRAVGFSRQHARIAELIVRDLCDKQIAIVLNISESTIDSHMERIERRTGTSGRRQLMAYLWEVSLQVRP